MYLLFPGRHHLLTNFQFDYLKSLIESNAESDTPLAGELPNSEIKIEAIIFAVTSANHSNTRRNPIAFHLRAMAIQDFASDLGIPFYVFGINDVGLRDDFAHYTLKLIEHETDGFLQLSPNNTMVICSTPVLELYEKIGFCIFKSELKNRTNWQYQQTLPWEIVEHLAKANINLSDPMVHSKMHLASQRLWERYRLVTKLEVLFADDLISDDGDITTSRDYNSYVRQMDEIAELKFSDTVSYIRPGRVGDIGCAVGSWIKLACEQKTLLESDFYGIEVARALFDICQQRKNNLEFKNPNVFFAKKNAITENVFPKASMDTIHTSSLTHEIESYGGRADLIQFIKNRYDELRTDGVWINRDVIGPKDGDVKILLRLSSNDGRNDDFEKVINDRMALKEYLEGLSTFTRFKRFAKDFRQMESYKMNYKIVEKDGETFIHLSLADACEFLSKKDYISNWQSEMHETFCYWSYADWCEQMRVAGFEIDKRSKAFTNDWIVKNRWESVAALFSESGNKMDWPVTHMILIGRKV